MENIATILSKYISERVPAKATNIFWQMFNGINAAFTNLEYRLDISKRERNMLTAQFNSSLRSLTAQNGFEPVLKIAASGLLRIKVQPKVFERVGAPLFIKPYSIFTNSQSKIEYMYVNDRTLKLDYNTLFVPVIEGTIKQLTVLGTGEKIQRIYITDENIAQNSIIMNVGGNEFVEVKSFFNNENLNENKQFLVKFSNNPQTPIIIYVKGLQLNDSLDITYRLSLGEVGNIDIVTLFNTESIVNSIGSQVDLDETEIEIVNISGFNLGSNGTDENSMRAAIGFNHSINLLFDNISYRNFINKYSTILLQDIKLSDTSKTINNIYISKKQSLSLLVENDQNIISQYKSIINNNSYLLTKVDKQNLDDQINEYEYCLTSHNLFDSLVNKYAFQITFETSQDQTNHGQAISILLYKEFSKFFYNKFHLINMELLFENYMTTNKITFDYMVFDMLIEQQKISTKQDLKTPYVISHTNYLPIISGDFKIADSDFVTIDLFFDINIVSKK